MLPVTHHFLKLRELQGLTTESSESNASLPCSGSLWEKQWEERLEHLVILRAEEKLWGAELHHYYATPCPPPHTY